jgi:DNA-binding response OmpR family regulator
METVLVIEDSRPMQRTLQRLFESDGLQVQIASDGTAGLETFRKQTPDIVVLDLKLPGVPGKELCRAFKAHTSSVPVVVLSANTEVEDKVLLLEIGADDYVTKPFSPRELLARVKLLLWRAEPPGESPQSLKFDELCIDLGTSRITCSEKSIPTSLLEFRLLCRLASHPRRVFTREELLSTVWGGEHFLTPRCVDVCVRRLREKIEADPENPRFLKTVRGSGYLFESRGD